jgi:two-component system, NtrC family, sensor kinase
MKPLKLYTRITILVSLVLSAVLLAVVFFFISETREIELQEQEDRARRLVEQLARGLPASSQNLAELRRYAVTFKEAHADQIQHVRVYGETKKGLAEVTRLSRSDPERISDDDLRRLKSGETLTALREVETDEGRRAVIYAAAPLFDGKRFEGVVSLTTTRLPVSPLARRLIWLTVALLVVALLGVTALLYFIFGHVIYRPLDALLGAMSEVKAGNLGVTAPVRARDEFGQLATVFNHMLARLRAMTEERAAHQTQLEERVREATAELAERNTELDERNAQLEEANAALFEMQRELTRFERLAAAGQLAAQFAHEVGTPLNLISGHVQLLAARTEDEKARERLDLIASQIARIERIVRHLLDATRRPRPQLAPTDLNALLRRIFDVTAPTLAVRGVELETSLDESLPPVLADAEQLQQVFLNLINNSLDAMPHGGRLSVTTSARDGFAEVGCRDTGTGISSDIRERIFDPLFTTKASGRGSGLGLTVVQKIIQEHGGQVEVRSELEQGAEFLISLPLAKGVLRESTLAANVSLTD